MPPSARVVFLLLVAGCADRGARGGLDEDLAVAVDMVPPCANNVKGGSETDVDCGGSCPACGDGRACKSNADCKSLSCRNGVCQPPACDDGAWNGMETDVDCG